LSTAVQEPGSALTSIDDGRTRVELDRPDGERGLTLVGVATPTSTRSGGQRFGRSV